MLSNGFLKRTPKGDGQIPPSQYKHTATLTLLVHESIPHKLYMYFSSSVNMLSKMAAGK